MSEVDIETFAHALTPTTQVVDVRERDEYAAGHVPGTVNIPMSQVQQRFDEFDRDTPLYLICATGNRSGYLATALARAGFEAINVAGGTLSWAQSGRTIEK